MKTARLRCPDCKRTVRFKAEGILDALHATIKRGWEWDATRKEWICPACAKKNQQEKP